MESNASLRTIFVVDDDRGLLRLIQKTLHREGFLAISASSGQGAIEWLAQNQPVVMLLDLKLQDLEGKEVIQRLTEAHRCPPFIIITGQGDERVAVDMMKRGAMDYLVKDGDFLQFIPAVVERVLDQLEKERRLAEVEEQVHLIRRVVEQGFSAVLITNAELPDPRIVYINPAFAQATGYQPGRVVGQPLSTLVGLTSVQDRLHAGMPKGERFLQKVCAFQTAAGERWAEWRIGPVADKAGNQTHWLFNFHDITERRRLEKQLLEISEQERQRVGQDLHDSLGGKLTGAALMSQRLVRGLAEKSKSEAAVAEELVQCLKESISETRAIAHGLCPVKLNSSGLAGCLEDLASEVRRRSGVECGIQMDIQVNIQNVFAATHLFRIVQEAVNNAIRHGNAHRLTIQVSQADRIISLIISDDGTGLSDDSAAGNGLGLMTMKHRASALGGQLQVKRGKRGGTVVSCVLPAEVFSSMAQQELSQMSLERMPNSRSPEFATAAPSSGFAS
jgi:PAS domain S-box-containing protein